MIILMIVITTLTFALLFAYMYLCAALIGNISLDSSIVIFLLYCVYFFYARYSKGDVCAVKIERRKKKNLNRTKLEDTTCQWFVFALKWGFYRKLLGYYMRYILYSIWTQAKICVHNSIYARQSYNNINK